VNQLKIGIITDPLETKSSVRVYLANLIESLFKLHHPGQIYLIHSRKSNNPLYSRGNEIILPGLYRENIPSASLADIFRPFLLRKYKFDVIHYTHSNPPLTFFSTAARNVCLITTVGPVTHPQYYPLASRYIARVARIANRRMDIIITESEAEKKEIVKFLRVNEEKVKVIPSGIDDIYRPLDNLNEIKSYLLTKYKIETPYILHVGAYRPVKNGPGLIKAFAKLKQRGMEHKLVLVGKPAQNFNEVLKLIKELSLEKDVIMTGFTRYEDLPKLYNAADLFVLPSFKESFPHVLVEALACGCPIVASDIACMLEIIGEAGIVIDPYDVDSLTEAMSKVITDRQLRQGMKKKALVRAELYSWEKCAQETLKVYEDLCQNGKAVR